MVLLIIYVAISPQKWLQVALNWQFFNIKKCHRTRTRTAILGVKGNKFVLPIFAVRSFAKFIV